MSAVSSRVEPRGSRSRGTVMIDMMLVVEDAKGWCIAGLSSTEIDSPEPTEITNSRFE